MPGTWWFLKSITLNWHMWEECFVQKRVRPLGAEKIVKLYCRVSERRRAIIWCCLFFLKYNIAGCDLTQCILKCAFKFCLVLINTTEPSVTVSVKLRQREARIHLQTTGKWKPRVALVCFTDIASEVLPRNQRCQMTNDVALKHEGWQC